MQEEGGLSTAGQWLHWRPCTRPLCLWTSRLVFNPSSAVAEGMLGTAETEAPRSLPHNGDSPGMAYRSIYVLHGGHPTSAGPPTRALTLMVWGL